MVCSVHERVLTAGHIIRSLFASVLKVAVACT